jgi:hypothetical protein
LGAVETESGHSDPQIRQLDRAEFLVAENVDVVGPPLVVVGRALEIGVVIPRGNEDPDPAERLELLLQELNRIRRDAIVLKKIAGDEDEIHGLAPGFLDYPAKGRPDRLALAVTQARGESRSGETGIQMHIGSMDEPYLSHDWGLAILCICTSGGERMNRTHHEGSKTQSTTKSRLLELFS